MGHPRLWQRHRAFQQDAWPKHQARDCLSLTKDWLNRQFLCLLQRHLFGPGALHDNRFGSHVLPENIFHWLQHKYTAPTIRGVANGVDCGGTDHPCDLIGHFAWPSPPELLIGLSLSCQSIYPNRHPFLFDWVFKSGFISTLCCRKKDYKKNSDKSSVQRWIV